MELGMREWLILGGVVLVLAVLFDGFRRMRSERSRGLKLSLGLGGGFADVDPYGSELPNGGARVVHRSEPRLGDTNFDTIDSGTLESLAEENVSAPAYSADDAHLNLGEALVTEHELLVFHVKSKSDSGFNGSDLLQILLACDLRYGDRDILHRHERADGEGYLQFSVANMLEPGTFSLEDINSFRTPGVTFFMALPGPQDPMQAFDCMLETANCLVKNLDAEILDEEHAKASPQIVNHYRDRVSRFMQRQAQCETA